MTTLIKSIIAMLTGCGCFLVGINLMSRGFVRICEKPGSKVLQMFRPKSGIAGVATGTAHSLLTQSSASTAVLTIKLINISAITLLEATPIIMGANIGTTITALIVSLSSLNVGPYLAFLVFIGSMMFLSNNRSAKIIGEIISGLGIAFVGLEMLNLYTKDAQISQAIISVFSLTDNIVLLLLFGCIVTAIFQSSSVTTSIMVIMVGAALLPLKSAVFIVMGANIGSCITSLLASTGGNKNAKRVALINVLFNMIGVVIFVVIILTFGDKLFGFIDNLNVGEGFKLAIFHLIFNVGTTIVLLPFVKALVWLAKKLIA